jgi:hypothetical protein
MIQPFFFLSANAQVVLRTLCLRQITTTVVNMVMIVPCHTSHGTFFRDFHRPVLMACIAHAYRRASTQRLDLAAGAGDSAVSGLVIDKLEKAALNAEEPGKK